MNEHPDAGELSAALEEELRQISVLAPNEFRMRLLVAAHCAGLIKRDLAAKAHEFQPEMHGVDQTRLVQEILYGARDKDIVNLRTSMKDEVREKLAVANPGYAQA
ncbi:MAG: hypothetical protein KA388_07030 [Rhodocyclaceae bacterium]|nr:hypothetical protein [Rhodocyclaceae bacterium]MBK9625850.1 hypothetical protein [Rhodocyclaceae bacterium]MBL0074578.1 hypothetical protein [Rhodocyclaceae bacterium]MBP6109124.1 hypothetical protein [Rhodocyclaceae bacterium]MBP6279501.1 hypothetical protein [Rhodocyclaceae bacterium]